MESQEKSLSLHEVRTSALNEAGAAEDIATHAGFGCDCSTDFLKRYGELCADGSDFFLADRKDAIRRWSWAFGSSGAGFCEPGVCILRI